MQGARTSSINETGSHKEIERQRKKTDVICLQCRYDFQYQAGTDTSFAKSATPVVAAAKETGNLGAVELMIPLA